MLLGTYIEKAEAHMNVTQENLEIVASRRGHVNPLDLP